MNSAAELTRSLCSIAMILTGECQLSQAVMKFEINEFDPGVEYLSAMNNDRFTRRAFCPLS
jgi:hypothetical protein